MQILTIFLYFNQYFASDLKYDFAGINFREWHCISDFAGINFRERQKKVYTRESLYL